jgi:hypothetical protein
MFTRKQVTVDGEWTRSSEQPRKRLPSIEARIQPEHYFTSAVFALLKLQHSSHSYNWSCPTMPQRTEVSINVTHKLVCRSSFFCVVVQPICIKHSEFSNCNCNIRTLQIKFITRLESYLCCIKNNNTNMWKKDVISWWKNVFCDLSVGCEWVKTRLPTIHA